MKYRLFTILTLFFFFFIQDIHAQLKPANGILYVSESGKGKKDGSSWANACEQLADPLLAAAGKRLNIKQIWVAAGTYTPKYAVDGTVPNDITLKTFVVPENISIYGGFPANPIDGVDMVDNRNVTANPTILQGAISGKHVKHVLIAVANSFRSSITVDGFVITGGAATGNTEITLKEEKIASCYGGGVYAITAKSHGEVILTNNTIKNNSATGSVKQFTFDGGNEEAILDLLERFNIETPDFLNSIISFLGENPVTLSIADAKGAGIYAKGTVTMTQNSIENNTLTSIIEDNIHADLIIAHGQGAGVFADGTVTFNHNTISSNKMSVESGNERTGHNIDIAIANGAGACLNSDITALNNTFKENITLSHGKTISLIKGGAFHLKGRKSLLNNRNSFANNKLQNNTSSSSANILALAQGGVISVKNAAMNDNQMLDNIAETIGFEFTVDKNVINDLLYILEAIVPDSEKIDEIRDLLKNIEFSIAISLANMQGGVLYIDQTISNGDNISNNETLSDARLYSSISGGMVYVKEATLKNISIANNITKADSEGTKIDGEITNAFIKILDLLIGGIFIDWLIDLIFGKDIYCYLVDIHGGEIYTKGVAECSFGWVNNNKVLANMSVKENKIANLMYSNVAGGVLYGADLLTMTENVISNDTIESTIKNNDATVNMTSCNVDGGILFVEKEANLVSNIIEANEIIAYANSDDDFGNNSNGRATVHGGAVYISSKKGAVELNKNRITNNNITATAYNDDTNEKDNSDKYDASIRGGGIYAHTDTLILPGISKKIKLIQNTITKNTITATTGDDDDVAYLQTQGAGIYALMEQPRSSIAITGNTIKENAAQSNGDDDRDDNTAHAESYGGGIALIINAENSEGIIQNNTIEENSASSKLASDAETDGTTKSCGGGVYASVSKGTLEIKENRVKNNELRFIHNGIGVGLSLTATDGGHISVTNNEITGNVINIPRNDANGNKKNDDLICNAYGGGIYLDATAGTAEIVGNTISRNKMLVNTYVEANDKAKTETNIHGGGLYAKGTVEILQNEIEENDISARATSLNANKDYANAYNYGGGIYLELNNSNQKAVIEQNKINKNKINTIAKGDDDYTNTGNDKAVGKGGGLYIQADKGDIAIAHNAIRQNAVSASLSEDDARDDTDARAEGGGIFIFAGTATITMQGDSIENNTLQTLTEKNDDYAYSLAYGGGLSIEATNSSASITANKLFVSGNSLKAISKDSYKDHYAKVEGLGGGVYLDIASSSATITNSLIVDNSTFASVDVDNDRTPEAFSYAGGVYVRSGNVDLFNSTIAGNSSKVATTDYNPGGNDHGVSLTEKGGGLYVYRGDVLVQNSIVWGNQLIEKNGNTTNNDMEYNDNAYVTLKNVLTRINKITGGTNVTVTATSPFMNVSDYHLSLGSQAFDAGTQNGLPSSNMNEDIEGNPRIISSQIDLGAFEFNPIPMEVKDTVICLDDGATVIFYPLKTPTTIYYSIGGISASTPIYANSSSHEQTFSPTTTTHYQIDSVFIESSNQKYILLPDQLTWTIEVIDPTPTSKSDTAICYGESVDLKDLVVVSEDHSVDFFTDKAAQNPIRVTKQTPEDTTTYYFIAKNETYHCKRPVDSVTVKVKPLPTAEIVNDHDYRIVAPGADPIVLQIEHQGIGDMQCYLSENGFSINSQKSVGFAIDEFAANPYIYPYAIPQTHDLYFIVLDSVVDQTGCMVTPNDTFFLYVVDCSNVPPIENIVCPDTMVVLPYSGCEFTFEHINGPELSLMQRYLVQRGYLTITNDLPADLTFPQGIHKIAWYWEDNCFRKDTTYQYIIVNYPPCNSIDTTWLIDEDKNIYYELDSLFATDFNGYRYPTARVGCDCWLAENMRTNKTADGTRVESYIYHSPMYPSRVANLNKYGRLYDWQNAVFYGEADANGNIPGICPAGWVLPSAAHWSRLQAYSSADLFAVNEWLATIPATNATGLSLLPGGMYDASVDGYYYLLGNAYFWTSEERSSLLARVACFLYSCPTAFSNDYNKQDGMSVRCVKGREQNRSYEL